MAEFIHEIVENNVGNEKKMPVTSIFSFSYIVLKRLFFQGH